MSPLNLQFTHIVSATYHDSLETIMQRVDPGDPPQCTDHVALWNHVAGVEHARKDTEARHRLSTQ